VTVLNVLVTVLDVLVLDSDILVLVCVLVSNVFVLVYMLVAEWVTELNVLEYVAEVVDVWLVRD
jgi:hypothetical protein